MKEIKIGDYIRTKNNGIKKVVKINENATINKYIVYGGIDKEGDVYYITIKITEILDCKENIIDLIKIGDYVNGHLVVDLSENVYSEKIIITEVDGKDGAIRRHYLDKSIKTILTKEQYERNSYKMEE